MESVTVLFDKLGVVGVEGCHCRRIARVVGAPKRLSHRQNRFFIYGAIGQNDLRWWRLSRPMPSDRRPVCAVLIVHFLPFGLRPWQSLRAIPGSASMQIAGFVFFVLS